MVTMVGTQRDFIDAIKALIELDYDAVEAYNAAIERLESGEYKAQLTSFREDHQRHIRELSELLSHHTKEIPTGPDNSKQLLAKGKVVIANLMGDNAILMAMISNEQDTNTAYDRIVNRKDIWAEALAVVRRGLEDEKRHKAWLESRVKMAA